jgi:hypothetical protein
MSYVRLEDGYDGVRVFFRDGTFTDKWIATLNRNQAHTIKFVTTFVPGYDNDVVRVLLDGNEKVCGTSWENYYRFDEQHDPTVTDRLMWRLNVDPATQQQRDALEGNGFLFDDVTSDSSKVSNPVGCSLPVGPAGDKGDKGDTGANGPAGAAGPAGATTTAVATASRVAPKLIGNTKRVIHVAQHKGERFLSARATLRNKRLPVHGRLITVDLRGRVVGNYNVIVVAKYKTKSGKVHVYRTLRNLSVTRAVAEARTPA